MHPLISILSLILFIVGIILAMSYAIYAVPFIPALYVPIMLSIFIGGAMAFNGIINHD